MADKRPICTIPLPWNNLDGCSFSDIIRVIEFTAELQSNDLTYQKPYTKKQQLIYRLFKLMHDEGLGYRRISTKLNTFGIKTVRNTMWNNAKVYSVLKRRHQRDLRIEEFRNKQFPIKVSRMIIKYYI